MVVHVQFDLAAGEEAGWLGYGWCFDPCTVSSSQEE